MPVWPKLVFNFWRFAVLKGLLSALHGHDVPAADVSFVDIVEGWDPNERRHIGRDDVAAAARCEYRGQIQALLAGEVDAIFGKGPEVALLRREAAGRIRMLYDLRAAPAVVDRINNSTPRLVTTSRHLVEAHFDATVRYLRTVVRAADWVNANPAEARDLIARECAIADDEIKTYPEPAYREKFLPCLDLDLVEDVGIVKDFLREHCFIEADFNVGNWIDARPLEQAYRLKGLGEGPSRPPIKTLAVQANAALTRAQSSMAPSAPGISWMVN